MLRPKSILIFEELLMFLLSIAAFSYLPYAWWVFPAVILLPDIGMLGYLIDNRSGAWLYNLFHHKGLAVIIFTCGLYFHWPVLQLTGIIMFGHASMDRVFGFGLKYEKGFKYTHLGKLK